MNSCALLNEVDRIDAMLTRVIKGMEHGKAFRLYAPELYKIKGTVDALSSLVRADLESEDSSIEPLADYWGAPFTITYGPEKPNVPAEDLPFGPDSALPPATAVRQED